MPAQQLAGTLLRFDTSCAPGTYLLKLVRKDGTVRIENDLYEVNLALRGLKVQLELDPWVMNPILVRYKGQDFGVARKVDRHLNSQIDGGRSSHE